MSLLVTFTTREDAAFSDYRTEVPSVNGSLSQGHVHGLYHHLM